MLDSITEPAILLSKEYRILAANTAYQSHYGAAPLIGEDTCYGISHGTPGPCDEHGEACPLGSALRSRHNERVVHVHHGPGGPEHVDVELRPLLDDEGEVEAFVEILRPVREASADAGEGRFVGRSRAFSELLALLRRAANSEVPVLLLGESGTGKELAARAVHESSPRRAGPFVPVECSGLTESLFESELFGHAKGAFTGAHARKPGLVEAALGGTLFLDEIGDVPSSLQVRLLRLLESRTYRPVGDVQVRRADFRLVCATHRDLRQMVAAGTFRRDLFFRLAVFPIHLPPLRERRDDLALLGDALLRNTGKQLSPSALNLLSTHNFPGNVRELRNMLERAVLLTDTDTIGPEHLDLSAAEHLDILGDAQARAAHLPTQTSDASTEHGAHAPWPWGDELLPLDEVERRYLRWARETHAGERRELARELGLSERTLYRKLRRVDDER